jgi:hypothetical protein
VVVLQPHLRLLHFVLTIATFFCVALNFTKVANAGCLMQRELLEAKQKWVQLKPLLAVEIDISNVASANLFCNEIFGFKVKIVFMLLCLLFGSKFELVGKQSVISDKIEKYKKAT